MGTDKINILIVEDNEDDLFFIKKTLDNSMFEFSIIKSGTEAYKYLCSPTTIPDVVLLDNMLPGMSGLEILTLLVNKVDNPAFIFLTVDNTIETAVKAMQAGALDFIVKSSSLKKELPEKIRKAYTFQLNKKQNKELQANFKSIIEAGNDLIWSIDKDFIITVFNKCYYNFYKKVYNIELHKGSHAIKLNPKNQQELWQSKYSAALNGEKISFEHQPKLGSVQHYFEVQLNPIIINNEIVGVSAISRDIKERKKNEIQLQEKNSKIELQNKEIKKLNEELEQKVKLRTQKLENAYKTIASSIEAADKANKAKSEFLANVSHEIRTPLNAVIGFSEILKQQINDPVQKDFVNSIKSSGKTLLGIINDVLDLSKIEAGKLKIHPKPTDFKNLIQETSNLFLIKVKEAGINFQVNISDQIPSYLMIDELRVKQVIINLISNAIKFTPSGFVKLSIESSLKDKTKIDLFIKVEDSGIGIKEDDQKKVFEAFHQNEKQNTKAYGGTGLGLAISQNMAKLMNGKIIVKSKINQGSTFQFILRDIKVSSRKYFTEIKSNWHPEDIEFKGSKILIIEDIEENRKVLKSMLCQYNLEIFEANDINKSFELYKEISPNLILLDIKMPDKDVYQVLQKIKKHESFNKIPVIVVTASVGTYMGKYKFDEVLHKPLELRELVDTLINYLPFNKSKKVELEEKLTDGNLLQSITVNTELRNTLINKCDKMIENLKKRKSIKVIKNLAHEIIEIGNSLKINELHTFGQNLLIAQKTFDIKLLEKLTTDFIDYYYSNIRNEEIKSI